MKLRERYPGWPEPRDQRMKEEEKNNSKQSVLNS